VYLVWKIEKSQGKIWVECKDYSNYRKFQKVDFHYYFYSFVILGNHARVDKSLKSRVFLIIHYISIKFYHFPSKHHKLQSRLISRLIICILHIYILVFLLNLFLIIIMIYVLFK
jgi:hypothetical protein